MVCLGKDGLGGSGSGNAEEGVSWGKVEGEQHLVTTGFGNTLDMGRRRG